MNDYAQTYDRISSFMDPPANDYNLQAEQNLLGLVLCDNRNFDKICDLISAESFYHPAHSRIFIEIEKDVRAGKTVRPTTLFTRFDADPDLAEAGGGRHYIANLVAQLLPLGKCEDYAKHINDLFIKRTLTNALTEANGMIAGGMPMIEVMETLRGMLDGFMAERQGFSSVSAFDSWRETKAKIEEAMNGRSGIIPTGYPSIDRYLKGYRPGALYVLAAKTGCGKTALALNLAARILDQGQVMICSMEMTREQLDKRIASCLTGIPSEHMDSGQLTDAQARTLFALDLDKKLHYYDMSNPDLATILSVCRQFIASQDHPRLIVIDYLGLIRGDYRLQKVHQIEEITKGLKQIALKFKIPILLLCQMSRGSDHREDKRPVLSDLRDSGAIEQDADVVMFIHREEMVNRSEPEQWKGECGEKYSARLAEYFAQQEANKGKAEILIRKNRHGPTGVVELRFDGSKQEFTEE